MLFSIVPNQREAAYCTAIEHGNTEDWEFLFDRYTFYYNSDDFSTVRAAIRDALTCSKDEWILSRSVLSPFNLQTYPQ